jgi:hypothetical protein
MKKEYIFGKGKWTASELIYARSPACMDGVKFRQEEDCIVNGKGKSFGGYEMIALLERDSRKVGARVETECSFDSFGAPLIVLTDDIKESETGEYLYGTYFEVVAYEDGINIWAAKSAPTGAECPIDATLVATKKFSIAGGARIKIRVETLAERIKAWVNGEYLETEVKGLPERFRVGITACEGINRFYSLTVEDGDKE